MMNKNNRKSGILLHITSLPGGQGVGDFGAAAYRFVDFLARAKQKIWQVLPLGTTGYGDSPYQSLSAFAGSHLLISLEWFIERHYLSHDDIDTSSLTDDVRRVDYYGASQLKEKALYKAYQNAFATERAAVDRYYQSNYHWLDDYAVFMIFHKKFGDVDWYQWPDDYRHYSKALVAHTIQEESDLFWYYIFCQFVFNEQWQHLKNYANERGIMIMGDVPIYVAADSADVWSNGELFALDDDKRMRFVAGCPPDAFSELGQYWGNPIYNWQVLAEQDYRWWIERLRHNLKLFDSLRIDHFRGFESYWQISADQDTAVNGEWVKGPGAQFFDTIKEALGDVDIIAEDLGFLTEEVIKLREYTGFAGMKILQFAFDPYGDSLYLPHNLVENSVVYTGTHDNETIVGWMNSVDQATRSYAIDYLKLDEQEGYAWGFIRAAWASVSRLAIVPLQDFLELDNSARINTPATASDNWLWRADYCDLTDQLADRIADLTMRYRR